MKSMLINSFLFLLIASSASAEKDRIGQNRPHFIPPDEMDISNSESNDEIEDEYGIASRVIVQGRTEPSSNCEQGNSRHHELPCDENVVSEPIIINPDPISGRFPVPNPDPSASPASAPSSSEEGDSSLVPSSAPQSTPVATPGSSPGSAPGSTPGSAPGSAPAAAPCFTTDGTFGEISDSDAQKSIPLFYFYEMKVVTGTEKQVIDAQILPNLEKAVVDSILQEVFPDKCATSAIGKRQLREIRNTRRLEVVGVSMYPPDYVTAHSCDVIDSSGDDGECYVVKGELTMYTEEDQVDQEQERMVNVIRELMNSGEFNYVSEDIIQLHYLNSSPETTESNIINDNDNPNNGVDKGIGPKPRNKGLRLGLLVGLGASVAILAGVIYRITRRIRNNDDQTEMQNSAAQTYLDVEGQRHSFN